MERSSLKKGNIVYYKDRPMQVYRMYEDEVQLKILGVSEGSVFAPYNQIHPVKIKDVIVQLTDMRGMCIERIGKDGEFYCIEHIGETFVCKYLHSFQNQFRSKYSKDFPVSLKLYISNEIYQ